MGVQARALRQVHLICIVLYCTHSTIRYHGTGTLTFRKSEAVLLTKHRHATPNNDKSLPVTHQRHADVLLSGNVSPGDLAIPKAQPAATWQRKFRVSSRTNRFPTFKTVAGGAPDALESDGCVQSAAGSEAECSGPSSDEP